jgi:hypothetical protein
MHIAPPLCITVGIRAEYVRDNHAGAWALLGGEKLVRTGVVARSARGVRANNLCYLAFVTGRIEDAIDKCTAALQLDPSLAAARNNPLVLAASGRMDWLAHNFSTTGIGKRPL